MSIVAVADDRFAENAVCDVPSVTSDIFTVLLVTNIPFCSCLVLKSASSNFIGGRPLPRAINHSDAVARIATIVISPPVELSFLVADVLQSDLPHHSDRRKYPGVFREGPDS